MEGWAAGSNDAAAMAAGRLGNRVTADARNTTAATGSAFVFQRRRVPINWRHLAGLDVDRVCREVDIQALQQNISNVTFCDIGSEDFHGVDGNFIKLFRLAQLTIEYLLHSQQYLSDQKCQLEQQVQQLQKEAEGCRGEVAAKLEEVKTLKRENRKRRKMLEAYQDMLNHGATGLHPCLVCSKEFVSQQYLDSHMHRRHPDHLQPTPKPGPSQEDIEKKLMEEMNEKFQAAQQQLREELSRKESESLRTQAQEFEQWKQAQQEKRKSELEEMQTPLLQQLQAVEQEKDQLQRVLVKTQAEIEAMKTLTKSLRTDDTVPGGSEMKEHKTTPETTTTAAAADMKRLETKVVSKWKKHKVSVHKQMEEMNKSYQDQLLELSKKLASMELSAKAQKLPSPDKTKTKDKQKESKMKREQEPQPTTTSKQTQTIQTVESQSEMSESSAEESEDQGDSEFGGGKEETDAVHFTPFQKRSNITTLFNHGQEAMEKIRRETATILENALVQRGVSKGTVGLSDALLQSKMKYLEAERKQRIQRHADFMEQRQQLASEVDLSANANCHFQPPQDLIPLSPPAPSSPSTRRSSPRRANSPLRTPPHQRSSPQKSSPQRGSPTRQQEMQESSGQAPQRRVNSKPPTGLPLQTQQAHMLQKSTREAKTESETETETESGSDTESHEDDNLQGMTETVTVMPARGRRRERKMSGDSGAKLPPGAVKVLPSKTQERREDKERKEEPEESSWDTSEESNDNLQSEDLMSVPTSTPIQVLPVKTAKISKDDHHQRLEELSDNSWDVTEISSESQPRPKRTNAGPPQDKHMKLTSTHSGNSQSALTTVSRGDFDDSDLSDISTTQLT